MIGITITGQSGVTDRLGQIVPASEKAIKEFAERIFDLARDKADDHTKTGALIRSLGRGPRKINGGYEIGHDLQVASHAVFVHWGSKPHKITPKTKKVLRWPAGGVFAFAKEVQHPGYKGDPWLINAADQALREFDDIVRRNMRNI